MNSFRTGLGHVEPADVLAIHDVILACSCCRTNPAPHDVNAAGLDLRLLFTRRGCASATMNSASTSQRNAARNAPARERRARVNPSTSCTDE